MGLTLRKDLLRLLSVLVDEVAQDDLRLTAVGREFVRPLLQEIQGVLRQAQLDPAPLMQHSPPEQQLKNLPRPPKTPPKPREENWSPEAAAILFANRDKGWDELAPLLKPYRPSVTAEAAKAKLERLKKARSRTEFPAEASDTSPTAPLSESVGHPSIKEEDWRPAEPTLAQKMAGR